ncbi:hypothetical protein ACWV26_02515 [Rummeliibacillus sp. JY-2-4R]
MGTALILIGTLVIFLSFIGVIVFTVLFVINRFKKGHKSYKKPILVSSGLIVLGFIFGFAGGAMSPADDSTNTVKSTSDDSKATKKEKPVAFSYKDSNTNANNNGDFKVPIKVLDGYVPTLSEDDGANITKKDSNHYILSGKISKKEDSGMYYVDFISDDDTQSEMIEIDNSTANAIYESKQRAIAQKKEKEDALHNEAKLSYGMLNKSQDGYIGEPYHITKGYVMQAMESNGETMLLVELTDKGYGFWDDIMAINYPNTTDAIDGDFVEVWGSLEEKLEYDTKIGGSNSVPQMTAESIKVIGHSN